MNGKPKILLWFFIFGFLTVAIVTYFASRNSVSELPVIPITKDINWALLEEDPKINYLGKLQYKMRCAKCHGFDGVNKHKNLNLTDSVWNHSDGSYEGVLNTIKKGVPNKMHGWEKKLLEDDLISLSVYVKSLSKNKK